MVQKTVTGKKTSRNGINVCFADILWRSFSSFKNVAFLTQKRGYNIIKNARPNFSFRIKATLCALTIMYMTHIVNKVVETDQEIELKRLILNILN